MEKFKLYPEQNLNKTMDNLSYNMQALEINVSEVLHNTIKTKTMEAKKKKLALWKKESV